jgi:WD40 repeat protein
LVIFKQFVFHQCKVFNTMSQVSLELFAHEYPLLVYLVSFLESHEIFTFELINRRFYSTTNNNIVWKVLSSYFFAAHNDLKYNDSLLRKIYRPFKLNTIGWKVRINQANPTTNCIWMHATIIDFRINTVEAFEEYLVSYDDDTIEGGSTRWEKEYRKPLPDEPFFNYGISRFEFDSPPCNSNTSNYKPEPHNDSSSNVDAMHIFQNKPLSGSSWRQEFVNLLAVTPSRRQLTLEVHTDEVLSVEFSHSGRHLACCSRDGTISVLQLDRQGQTISFTRLIAERRNQCGFLTWSPNDDYLLVRSETDNHFTGLVEVFLVSEDAQFERVNMFHVVPCYFFGVWTSPHVCLVSLRYIHYSDTGLHAQELCELDLRTMVIRSVLPQIHPQSLIHLGDLLRLPFSDESDSASTRERYSPHTKNFPEFVATPRTAAESTALAGNVFAHAAGTKLPHQNLICLLPLNGVTLPAGHEAPLIRHGAYPVADVNGAIISIKAVRAGGDTDKYLMVNVRPALEPNAYPGGSLLSVAEEMHPLEVPEIAQEVELRLYCGLTLQCLRVFKGHYSFTLKHCPFFVTVDSIEAGRRSGDNSSFAERSGSLEAQSESEPHTLFVSGSESGDVFLWSSVYSQHHGRPMKVGEYHPLSGLYLFYSYRVISLPP